MSPATRALMCDDEHVNISGKETSARVRTSQEKEDNDTSSEVYVEQEKLILSSFRDHLIQLLNRGSINVLVKNCTLFLLVSNLLITGAMETHEAVHFRSQFLHVLLSRRSAPVPLVAECSKPVANPVFQSAVPSLAATESCPKEHMDNSKSMLKEENIHLHTEAGEQGRLPLLILSLKDKSVERRPAVVFMHASDANKEWLRPFLEAYASRGYVAIGLDSRYHGERADSKTAYRDALISSWKNGNTMPFIFDTVWDLIKLAEYLTQRKDIDPQRIGITGISLGGMQAWFAAAVDTRYSVAVPLIGVQGFRWAIDNDAWQARVDSLKPLFEVARIDMGKSKIDKEVVEKVWDRIAPGIASQFDAPYSVPVIAPRPLYLLNGAEDPRCPLGGLVVPVKRAKKAYKKTPANFKFVAEEGVGHTVTSFMIKESSDWFEKFLKQGNMTSH
ncbi:hypothetical protein HID58_049593 [Brassica napus]|uniref:Peptidase S9 prolyl oligopeptidase catalytic domain-containing protein n=1 Tax=Brassica napus TaxID=3708 RepID=A0ABQ8B705_BRANA|nr:hypothetical protein HID58_049593 [Brassica napus]